MKKIDILDFNNFVAFEELTNVNVIKINELPFFDETSALTVKVQRGSEELPRVEVAEADAEGSIGGFTIDNNQLIFVINKNMTECDAHDYIVGLMVIYTTKTLCYQGTAATYSMTVRRGCDSRIVSVYEQMSLSELVRLIPTLDSGLAVDITGGYIYEISRDKSVSCTQ